VTDATLDLIAVDWERVQLEVRLRGSGEGPAASNGFALLRSARGRVEALPATSATAVDDGWRIRFNIMAGPRSRPLDPGVWTLARSEASGWVPLQLGIDAAFPEPGTRSFRLPHARLDATVVTDAGRGALELIVAIDRFGGRIAPRWPRWRIGRRPAQAARHAGRRVSRRLLQAALRSVSHRTGRRVVFASASRRGLVGNLQVVHDRMVERGLDADYDLVVLNQSARLTGVRRWRDRWRSARILLGAEAILVAGSLQRAVYGQAYDPDVRFIQLWHASGAFKTVGYSRVGKDDAPDPFSRVHKTYTHAIVSSAHDVPFYAEAFSIPEARVVPTGIPRMDRFFDDDARTAGVAAALAGFPTTAGKTVWLFAPTYRDEARAATYPSDRIDFAAFHALAAEKDAVVIFKMHPFVLAPLDIPEAYSDRLIDGTRTKVDVNDLLFIVDLLITDYSSIVFEYSTLDRPMLFYAFDLDEYIAQRDFYVPFEAFVPGRIVRTFPELLDAIRRDDCQREKVGLFARAHFDHLDATSTDRVIDELIIAR
jgi:CDP-ribitol ribitolphosphotransferase